jgi:hypothetical protein
MRPRRAHRLEGVGVFSLVHLGETECPAESSSIAGLRSPETSASVSERH